MTHSFAQKLGVCSLVAVMTVALSTTGLAAEPPSPRPTLLASAQKQVQQIVKVTKPAARSAQEGVGYDEPGAFFKTRRGVALLVLAAVGIGYMTFSAFDDRIHSQARERLDN